MKTITIAICTHNRADVLKRFLPINIKALRGHGNVQILVIDNHSTDETPTITRAMQLEAKSVGVSFKVVREEVLGLSAARNRAILEFDSELLAFLDDDAYITNTWPAAISEAFDNDPTIIAAGGPVLPIFEIERPNWLIDRLLWAYSLDMRKNGDFNANRHPLGVNMIFARETIKNIQFSMLLGRIGHDLSSAEETAIFNKIFTSQQGKVKFVNLAIVHHFIEKRRLTREWLLERHKAEGRSQAIASKILGKSPVIVSLRLMAKIIIGWIFKYATPEPFNFLIKTRMLCWKTQLQELWKSG